MVFSLKFSVRLGAATTDVNLFAEASYDMTKKIFHISHITSLNHCNVLPDISIRKRNSEWIDTDCLKENELSRAAGGTIEKLD